ncbi:beta-phosphoglucomutase family hydrolase [Paenarthrobacter sp. PH39-S1]|uniref:beta-phosphoglucomutase family hydrolase n=1 Tax=Paenarthrobacter sp. PH39-S1 TaxID=3046204 RepID=UPI0024B94C25|nr:beta-phosphoglucomutase family hydrolase [Paenarthrobacter sp. PH39-S1]MDJ0355253.1 beta-phosphoglucomutase family hydrolase [Paenarthrobacter sp. PH39-S1]
MNKDSVRTGAASVGLPDGVRACLFDLDGVLTKTALVHAAAWKEMFDGYLRASAARGGTAFVPFDPVADYDQYVDGKSRADGTRAFLAARGIVLPEGSPKDETEGQWEEEKGESSAGGSVDSAAAARESSAGGSVDSAAAARESSVGGPETVESLGDRKNRIVLGLMKENGVEVYDGSLRYVHAVRSAGLRCAVVSSSANCQTVLAAAGIQSLFDERVDGITAQAQKLKGKPAPDMFLAAARALGMEPEQCAVFEDALAGVAAGRAGGFARVVGVDRAGQAQALGDSGADVVVSDPADLLDRVVREQP